MTEAEMEKKARKDKKKEEKRTRKAEKKARNLEMEASMAEGAMGPPVADASIGAGLIHAAQKLLESQAAAHAQAHEAWQKERKAFQEKEARLLDLVDSLTARIAEMSRATASPSPTRPPSPEPSAAAVSVSADPKEEEQEEEEPASLLGGRGVFDIVDLIEESNRRMKAESPSTPDTASQSAPEPAMEAEPPIAVAKKAPNAAEVEVVDVDKTQPVLLQIGSTDIYWVNQLQAALLREGLYCGEEEMEEWYFGHHTQEALMTYQACNGLPETGIANMDSWEKLLGPGFRAVTKDEMPIEVQQAAEAAKEKEGSTAEDAKDLFGFLNGNGSEAEASEAAAPSKPSSPSPPKTVASAAASAPSQETYEIWPILRMDDGNPAVHRLHAALDMAGFDCGEDEMQWWMFGDMTQLAVSFFQACNGLPETGIVDEHTWKKLLNNPDAIPNDIADLNIGNSYDEDISGDIPSGNSKKRIWLVGEQRWSELL